MHALLLLSSWKSATQFSRTLPQNLVNLWQNKLAMIAVSYLVRCEVIPEKCQSAWQGPY